ncbi:PREDICTED: keratin-associated protein 19-2-like [Papilio xuthus]|uniref:Keratin-associated protein 19-2-like n=1 Tax=Papilio xuthus TaxID=66420 RepID=A0AAJ6ZRD9_PAPXU|nr:PREDICTED: keratin-associated protein 19-2-like [Papilio xuthus]
MWKKIFVLLPIICCINAVPQNKEYNSNEKVEKDDLKTAASSYSHQYSDWGGSSPGGYGYSVTGFGLINDKYDANYGGISGHNTYPTAGYPGYSGGAGLVGSARPLSGAGYVGNTGFSGNSGYAGNSGFSGYKGYGGYNPNLYGSNGGYGTNLGYGSNGGFGGNGGYGGYGGNGGLGSYSGYNNPYYQGSNHLGYGYYQPGNIYKGGSITPSYVNGYRGYTRR